MSVKVLYFASLRERRGRSEELVDIAAGTTAASLYARLFPTDTAPTVAYTRNRVVVPGSTLLVDGDEVAFLPPLGGG